MGPKKILVADDNVATRQFLRRELESGGYEIFEAADGKDALDKIAALPVDLAVLDVDMPHMDGFETCENIRSGRIYKSSGNDGKETLPVIFLVDEDTLEDRTRGFEAGSLDFIVKQFRHGELLAACGQILQPPENYTGLTVLVADDSRLARRMIAETLRKTGIEAIEAENGAKVEELLRSRGKTVDMAIIGVRTPAMDGGKLCEKIRHEFGLEDMPIIFLYREEEKTRLLGLYKAGATDSLAKPFFKEELLGRLRFHLTVQLQSRAHDNAEKELEKLHAIVNDSFITFNCPEPCSAAGEERELTIMFTDLQGFTSMSRKVAPRELLELLNEYLEGMTEILERHGGTLDKYEGDALIAFWNAPAEQKDHALRAASAALEMLKFTEALSEKFRKEGKPPLKTRIGINTGKAVIGNIGSKSRSTYAIVGSEVRLAHKLEEANKGYGTYLTISESTYRLVKDAFRARELEPLSVEGRADPIKVYQLLE